MTSLMKRSFNGMIFDTPNEVENSLVFGGGGKRCRPLTPNRTTVTGSHKARASPNLSSPFQSRTNIKAETARILTHSVKRRKKHGGMGNGGGGGRKSAASQAASAAFGNGGGGAGAASFKMDDTMMGGGMGRERAGASAGAAEQPPNFDENGSQVMFTLEQVRSILERALEDKEVELSAKYDELLTDRLQDQFAMFSKFNEDHIHQKLANSEFSYYG